MYKKALYVFIAFLLCTSCLDKGESNNAASESASDLNDWDQIRVISEFFADVKANGWSLLDIKRLATSQAEFFHFLAYDLKDLNEANDGNLLRQVLRRPNYEGGKNFLIEYIEAYKKAVGLNFMDSGSFADHVFSVRASFAGRSLGVPRMEWEEEGEVRYQFLKDTDIADLKDSSDFKNQVKAWWDETPYLDKSVYEVFDKNGVLDWEKTWEFFTNKSFVKDIGDLAGVDVGAGTGQALGRMRFSFDPWGKYFIHSEKHLTPDNEVEVKKLLNGLHEAFLKEMNAIKGDSGLAFENKIRRQVEEIMSFSRKLIYAHPFPDGNGRVFTNIIVRQLLIENDMPQSLFDPQLVGNSFLTIKEMSDHVVDGMKLFNKVSLDRQANDSIKTITDLLESLKAKLRLEGCGG